MQIIHKQYDTLAAEKAIDKYVINPEKELDNILKLMQDNTITIANIPKAKQTKKLLLSYLEMPETTYVRVKWISKKLLDDEVWSKLTPKCHDYDEIPPQFLNEKSYLAIAKSFYYAKYKLHLIPSEKMTEELLLEALVVSFDCLKNPKLDKSIFEKFDIDSLKEKAIQVRENREIEQVKADNLEAKKNGWIVNRTGYDYSRKVFFFSGKKAKHCEWEHFDFKTFDEFYKFMLGILPEDEQNSEHPQPLAGIDLMNYDFGKTDLSKYNLSGCFIRPDFLEKSNCFIDCSSKLLPDPSIEMNDIEEEHEMALVHYGNNTPVKLGDVSAKNFRRLDYYYISDIHLTHRVLNQLGKRFTKEQVEYLIKGIANNVRKVGITLIAGDTSQYFLLNELFYSYIDEYSYGLKVIVLGNHELWDESLYCDSPIDDVINAYKQLHDSKDRQVLLQNELLVENDSFRYILSENDILNMDASEIVGLCENADNIILGGIGFTGYCQVRDPKTKRIYNAEFGLYRKALTTLEEDLQQTQRFEAVYRRIRDILSNRKVIVLTHTPKECWSKDPYVTNWVYVNGHTHRNIEVVTEEKMLFADNQIGYHNEDVQLKSFFVFRNKDLFYEHLEDGIHEITIDQYREFNRSKGIYASVRPGIGKILMLKKEKLYMFLLRKIVKSGQEERLYILDGGAIHTAYLDEQYYYDNMHLYVKAVKSVFKKYWEAQKIISKEIRSIGGDGTIHGCIIDIDYYNHIYLNPSDGKLTFYFADSITQKYVYESIEALLIDQSKKSIGWDKEQYKRMLNKYRKSLPADRKEKLQSASTTPYFVASTDMYKVSRVIKRLQHITDNNILRVWHNGVLEYYLGKSGNQLMDFNVSFKPEEIDDKYEVD